MTRNPKGINGLAFSFTYADATARNAGTGDTLTLADVGKFALQASDGTLWRLVTHSPIVWAAVGGGGGGGGVLPVNHTLFPFTFTRSVSATPPYNTPNRGDMIFNMWTEPQGGSDEGDSAWIDIPLADGSYNLEIVGSKGENRGAMQWDIDGVNIGSPQDWYDASDQPNSHFSETFTVPTGGIVRLRFTMTTRNAAAVDDAFFLAVIWITPA